MKDDLTEYLSLLREEMHLRTELSKVSQEEMHLRTLLSKVSQRKTNLEIKIISERLLTGINKS